MVSFASEANAVVTTGWSATVSGLDFGFEDATLSARIGLSACYTSAWVSTSSVACFAARGHGPLKDAVATVCGVVGTQTSVFSYDGAGAQRVWSWRRYGRVGRLTGIRATAVVVEPKARPVPDVRARARTPAAPVVSFLRELNAAGTAAWSVTVSGIDFGASDASPTARLGATSCPTAAWASSTSVVCFVAPGEGPRKDAAMTVEGVVGTRTRAFSYDGAVVQL